MIGSGSLSCARQGAGAGEVMVVQVVEGKRLGERKMENMGLSYPYR